MPRRKSEPTAENIPAGAGEYDAPDEGPLPGAEGCVVLERKTGARTHHFGVTAPYPRCLTVDGVQYERNRDENDVTVYREPDF